MVSTEAKYLVHKSMDSSSSSIIDVIFFSCFLVSFNINKRFYGLCLWDAGPLSSHLGKMNWLKALRSINKGRRIFYKFWNLQKSVPKRLSSVAPPEVADECSFAFILEGPGLDVIFSPALLDSPWLLGIAYVPYSIELINSE